MSTEKTTDKEICLICMREFNTVQELEAHLKDHYRWGYE